MILHLHPASFLRICVLYYNGNLTVLEINGISYEFPRHTLIFISWRCNHKSNRNVCPINTSYSSQWPIYHIQPRRQKSDIFSMYVQHRDPKEIVSNRVPFFETSHRQGPPSCNTFVASRNVRSSASCISINTIPSTLQSVLRNIGLEGSYRANTGELVISLFISSKSWSKVGVHTMIGIGFLK